ncbi:EAL domain-containing protein [Shewanella sp. Isolate11]|uniref:EAL domain-containing protein n=1 Tax=Shewanella sp. Isolate11 TaxID=2908530 RepID=UPI001EFEB26E|nr:EAL domain-containing protein [Shewanella sp. Isolate11]MCG9698472.1 EAL domain-containing protein [Shewanella sp. Isolate11]
MTFLYRGGGWFKPLTRLNQTPLIMSMREGFIALIPFFVISAIAYMLLGMLPILPDFAAKPFMAQMLNQSHHLILAISPLAVVISLSFHLSKNLRANTIVGSILASLCFMTHSNYLVSIGDSFALNTAWPNFYSIFIPLITPYLVRYFSKRTWLHLVKQPVISPFLQKHLNLILPFFLVYLTLYLILPVVEMAVGGITHGLLNWLVGLSVGVQGFVRMLLIHGLWFLGIHGDNTYTSLFSDSLMQQPFIAGISFRSFYNTFVIIGGSGCLLSLVIAIFICRSPQELAQARVSLPFNLFNFSELIVYALPVVFNPVYLIPFLLVPMSNFLLSYWVLSSDVFLLGDQELSWMTPVLINAWLISKSINVVAYQALLIALNVMIYIPFVLLSKQMHDCVNPIERLTKKFKLADIHQLDAEARFSSELRDSHVNSAELHVTLSQIDAGQLVLYYQPKVDTTKREVVGFEALLRLKTADGLVQGPWFIEILERNNLVPMVDAWVIRQVKRDLLLVAEQGSFPKISINLHPMSLQDDRLVTRLAELNREFPKQLQIELLESAFIDQRDRASTNLSLLQQQGVSVAIDDFGRGFSNLSRLIQLAPQDIKLDRSMLLATDTAEGLLLYKHMAALCRSLGYQLVAEGVETAQQLALVHELGVNCIQGWFFAEAMPLRQAMAYQLPETSYFESLKRA